MDVSDAVSIRNDSTRDGITIAVERSLAASSARVRGGAAG